MKTTDNFCLYPDNSKSQKQQYKMNVALLRIILHSRTDKWHEEQIPWAKSNYYNSALEREKNSKMKSVLILQKSKTVLKYSLSFVKA